MKSTTLSASLLACSVLATLLAMPLFKAAPAQPMLLAPMIGQMEPCLTRSTLPPDHSNDPAFIACISENGSSAAIIESTLAKLGPRFSANERYELGYSLNVPLLKFWTLRNGSWELDREAIDRTIKTIEQSDRRLILYFFSTHFSTSTPIEQVLAADIANLAITQEGPLGIGKHYSMDVYPWTVARTDNSLTRARLGVIKAFVEAICQHPNPSIRKRIDGITLLGEVHHLFPDFEAGMGYIGKYLITDYSPESAANFREYLKQKYGKISKLNQAIGEGSFTDFDSIEPPSKDIQQDKLKHFWEHIDAYSSGSFPVSGWLAPHDRLNGWVQIYINGKSHARVRANLGRQDVLDQLPHLQTANVGWRSDVDFHTFTPGTYEIAALAETHEGPVVLLGSRTISVMDRAQSTPHRISGAPLPEHVPASGIHAHMDLPKPDSAFFYNPLAVLWHQFREQQVVNYLHHMAQPLRDSCLAGTPRYVHQLFPFPNPSWDTSKFAVNASLTHQSDLRLGISLYGEASYGRSFFDWKHKNWPNRKWLFSDEKKIYGITEFHPLRGMNAVELQATFDQHLHEGAQFLSFFLEGRGSSSRPYLVTTPSIPFLGETNTQNGSDELYRSVQQIMLKP